MSKIVCDICGTTYPETATQCPICGSARPADAQPVETSSAEGYQYVKGGRFSKANVRKRNNGIAPVMSAAPKAEKKVEKKPVEKSEKKQTPAPQPKEKTGGSDSNRGLIITAIVLLVAVIAVVGYIAVRYFFVPETEGAANVKDTIACVSVSAVDVDDNGLTFDLNSEDKTYDLKVITTPTNTTDEVTYESDNTQVVTVDKNGKVTAVGVGTANITISCGTQSDIIKVTVGDSSIEETDTSNLRFISTTWEMLVGETSTLYTKEIGGIDPAEITWTTDDEEKITIENGVVKALAEGVVTVHGEFEDVKFSCVITVTSDEENGGNGVGPDDGNGVGPDDGNNNGNTTPVDSIHFCTLWSSAPLTEFTIGYNESLTLLVKDSNGNTVDATITVADEGVVTVSGNVVTYVSGPSGVYTTLTATYNGMSVTCKVLR